jgi:hypothetical protein
MGAKCFCGCGRTISLRRLVLRSHNNAGHEVVKQLTWLRDGLAETDATPDAEEKRWLEEGDTIVDMLARAAHGELKRPNLVAIAEWRKEGRAAESELKRRRFERKLAFGHLVRKGADPAEAARAVIDVERNYPRVDS